MSSVPSVISLCAGHNALRLRKDAALPSALPSSTACPLVALSRHFVTESQCPLLGVKRTPWRLCAFRPVAVYVGVLSKSVVSFLNHSLSREGRVDERRVIETTGCESLALSRGNGHAR